MTPNKSDIEMGQQLADFIIKGKFELTGEQAVNFVRCATWYARMLQTFEKELTTSQQPSESNAKIEAVKEPIKKSSKKA
jgi:hypothetical protein